MIDLLTGLGVDPRLFTIVAIVSTIVFILSFRRYFLNIFDPLALFVLSMVADSTLVFALPWPNTLKVEFTFFVLFLWLGFIASGKRPAISPPSHRGKIQTFELEVVLLTLFFILFIGNIYIGLSSGFPLLTSDPSISKVTIYTGGLGAIKRLNMLPYVFLCSGSVFMAVIGYKRLLFLLILISSSLLMALTGGKGTLASPVFVLAFVVAHPGLVGQTGRLVKRIKRYTFLLLLVAVTLALTITSIDTGGVIPGLLALMKRIIFYGDIVFYYFPTRATLIRETPMLGFFHYLFQSTLTMFRLIENSPSLGAVIMGAGEEGFGPNPQYFVVGDLFFGPVFGCVYCFLIGYLIATVRKSFFSSSFSSPMRLVLTLTIAVSVLTLATDAGMFVSQLIDLLLVVGPLWIIAHTAAVASRSVRLAVE